MDVVAAVSFVWSGSWDPAALAIAHRTLRFSAIQPTRSNEVLIAYAVASSKLASIQRRSKLGIECTKIYEHLRYEPQLHIWSAAATEVFAATSVAEPALRMQHSVRMMQVSLGVARSPGAFFQSGRGERARARDRAAQPPRISPSPLSLPLPIIESSPRLPCKRRPCLILTHGCRMSARSCDTRISSM